MVGRSNIIPGRPRTRKNSRIGVERCTQTDLTRNLILADHRSHV